METVSGVGKYNGREIWYQFEALTNLNISYSRVMKRESIPLYTMVLVITPYIVRVMFHVCSIK